MQSRLFLALGSAAAAWLITANLASADEIGTGSKKATEGTQTDVSTGNESSMPTDISSGVEYRRNDRSAESSRTGRSDQSAASARSGGGQSDSSGGGEGGEGGGGEGAGPTD